MEGKKIPTLAPTLNATLLGFLELFSAFQHRMESAKSFSMFVCLFVHIRPLGSMLMGEGTALGGNGWSLLLMGLGLLGAWENGLRS